MHEPLSARRLAENEVFFRQFNEAVTKNVASVGGNVNDEAPIEFYCECSSDECIEKIPLTLADFISLHNNSDRFVLIPGHQINEIENVVFNGPHYIVVEKIITSPPYADHLNPIN
jgi:hypothetical protein